MSGACTPQCPEGATLRGRLSPLFAAAVGLGIIATAGACGGDSDSETSEPSVATSAATQEATGDLEGYETFISSGLNYSIAYPESWSAHEGSLALSGVLYDLFSAPRLDENVVPNIIVGCHPIPSGTTTNSYLESIFAEHRKQGVEPVRAGTVKVVGSEVPVFSSQNYFEGRAVDVLAVVFAHGECGWEVSLTTAAGLNDKYEAVLLSMTRSFATNEQRSQ